MSAESYRNGVWRQVIIFWLPVGTASICFVPLLSEFFVNLWHQETEQFFPLALIGSGLLAWRGLSEVPVPLRGGTVPLTLVLLALFLLLTVVATLLWSPWINVGAILVGALTLAWWLGAAPLIKAVLPAWLMFLTIIPPPLELGERFALFLQHNAVVGSSFLLSLLKIPHLRSGNILEIPGARLLVEQACSGINSVLFMAAACVFYTLWQRRSFLFFIILTVLTMIWIFISNLIRITFSTWILYNFNINLFSPFRHEAVGLFLTASTFLFIFVSSKLLEKLVAHPNNISDNQVAHPVSLQMLVSSNKPRGGYVALALIIMILAIIQLNVGLNVHHLLTRYNRIDNKNLDGSKSFSLPVNIEGWTLQSKVTPIPVRTAFESGIYSHIWIYKKEGVIASISLDYPFYFYHDVRLCYLETGWSVIDSKLSRGNSSDGNIPDMEVTMVHDSGLNGFLLFSTVNQSGQWVEGIVSDTSPPDATGIPLEKGGFYEDLVKRLRRNFTYYDYSHTSTCRIQILASSSIELDEQEKESINALFRSSRLQLVNQLMAPHPKMKPANNQD